MWKDAHILIAADSFKDALPAMQVCEAIERGILRVQPRAETRCLPLADGGEGTFEVLSQHLGLIPVETNACDALLRPIRAVYGLSADGHCAFIELAKTAGIQLLNQNERNPLNTSTFGVGLQLADALRRGAREIILAIGGSATNDAGMGMAAALGWQFSDENGALLPASGAALGRVRHALPPAQFPDVSLQVICDVTNPLYGPQGAARVYGPQKGADAASVEILDAGLRHFSAVVGPAVSPETPGAGAAGGMGFGAMVFLNAQLRRGIDLVLDLSGFEEYLAQSDMIITGEGKLDGQTAAGKLIQGICRRAAGKPVVAFCGKVDASTAALQAIGLQEAVCINPDTSLPLHEMLAATAQNLEAAAAAYFSR